MRVCWQAQGIALSSRPAQSNVPMAMNGAPPMPGFAPMIYAMPPQMMPAHAQAMHQMGGVPIMYPGPNGQMQHAFA